MATYGKLSGTRARAYLVSEQTCVNKQIDVHFRVTFIFWFGQAVLTGLSQRSPDVAKRNPGNASTRIFPDSIALHPGYACCPAK